MNDLDVSIQKTTLEQKGDWKPIIFLITDGTPTDRYEEAFEQWGMKHKVKTNLVVVSLGENTDVRIFNAISDNVLTLKNTDSVSFNKFFKWVTASIKTSSISIAETKNDGIQLAPFANGNLSKIDLEKNTFKKIDENFAVILAKCQTTRRSYLIKYKKRLSDSEFKEIALYTLDYKLVGAFPIESSYFDLADGEKINNTINTSELVGFPSCPCCGNQYGLSHCSCGNIMCTGDEKISHCPWCELESEFGFGADSTNINRTRG
jgi:hypothetical protein